jgi:predicted neuraminidase
MWRNILSCALALGVFSAPVMAADDIVVEKVIGTEKPGAYKHPAAITELDNGDLYITFYGGGGEYEDESKVYGIRRAKGETTWSEPQLLADTPFQGEGNGIVWQAPDGLVWLFYVQRYGDTWSESRIKAKISEDGAKTWSDSMVLSFEMGTMVRGRPIVLNNGEYLLPVYLVAYCRVGGGYEPSTDRYLVRSESFDGGETWKKGKDSQFPNPNAAVSFIKLQNGHLLLAYNDNMNERIPLTIAISEDNDKTWPHRRDIVAPGNTFAYPMAIQAKDGTIHVVYTTDSRATVMLTSFKEEAILGHTK